MINNEPIIFAGTPKISIIFIEKLLTYYNLQAVITKPDSISGRNKHLTLSPIKKYSITKNIKVFTPTKLNNFQFISEINKINPSIIIVANYSLKIPSELLSIPSKGILCFHPSLLPKYRGPSPIQSAILNNETITGFTFFLMDEQFDHGTIIYQKKLKIVKSDNNQTLTEKLFNDGAQTLTTILDSYLKGKIKSHEQNHQQASYTKYYTRKDGYFDFSETAEKIFTKYKAFYPWPGIWTYYNNKRLKITNMNQKNEKTTILKVQLEGKRETTLKEFVNGHQDFTIPKLFN